MFCAAKYKRLERGRFRLPVIAKGAKKVELEAAQLMMLLDGIDYSRVRQPRLWHPGDQKQKKIAPTAKI